MEDVGHGRKVCAWMGEASNYTLHKHWLSSYEQGMKYHLFNYLHCNLKEVLHPHLAAHMHTDAHTSPALTTMRKKGPFNSYIHKHKNNQKNCCSFGDG